MLFSFAVFLLFDEVAPDRVILFACVKVALSCSMSMLGYVGIAKLGSRSDEYVFRPIYGSKEGCD